MPAHTSRSTSSGAPLPCWRAAGGRGVGLATDLPALEEEPRALEAAQQLAGLVNLCGQVALERSDPINRVAVIKVAGAQ